MSSVSTIINVISYVLIAFVAISLVVSSIMIGVITLISVQERTKEIGILRAMGASKRDVSRVFNAETIIIGLISGLIGIGVTLLLLILPRTRRAGAVCAAALVLNLLLTNVALKNIIQRIRPYEVINSLNILIEAQHDFSFPSGHTIASFEAAVVMLKNSKKMGIPAMILAILISFSRLYLYVHYPTDVIFSIFLGTAFALFAYWKFVSVRVAYLKFNRFNQFTA